MHLQHYGRVFDKILLMYAVIAVTITAGAATILHVVFVCFSLQNLSTRVKNLYDIFGTMRLMNDSQTCKSTIATIQSIHRIKSSNAERKKKKCLNRHSMNSNTATSISKVSKMCVCEKKKCAYEQPKTAQDEMVCMVQSHRSTGIRTNTDRDERASSVSCVLCAL